MRLKEIRKASGETQAAIAEVIGVTRAAYANIENGKREPDFKALLKLADYFDVTLDYLFGRSENSMQASSQSLDLSVAERALVIAYRAASQQDRDVIENIVGRYAPPAKTKTSA